MAIKTLALFGQFGMPEILLLALVGLLLFGKRLPEVGRSLGRGIVEFKKGLSGVEDDVKAAGTPPPAKPAEQIEARPQGPSISTSPPAAKAQADKPGSTDSANQARGG